jgi:hypothetical protein
MYIRAVVRGRTAPADVKRRDHTMHRRKFMAGLGSIVAGTAAAIGTGAFEGAYVNGDRALTLGVVNDSNAYLQLIDTSPHASYRTISGGWENGSEELQVVVDRLNPNADTRLDDVFRVRNTTGEDITLLIDDSPDWNGGYEDTLQIWAQPSSGGPVRLDDGGSIDLGPGEEVEINIIVLLNTGPNKGRPNGHTEPDTITITADGTDSNA